MSYFADFWNKIDCIIIITLTLYYVLSVFPESEFMSNVNFSIATMLMIIRGMEYFGLFIPRFGLFVAAFSRIFGIMFFFIVMIMIIATACAVGLAPFICKPDYHHGILPKNMNPNFDYKQCDYYNHTESIEAIEFQYCVGLSLRHLIVDPFGLSDYEIPPMECYSATTELWIQAVKAVYYLTVSIAVLRGVLVKFLLGSRTQCI